MEKIESPEKVLEAKTIAKLVAALDFPEEELEHAALKQASLYRDASKIYIVKMRRHLMFKAKLKERESAVSLILRKKYADEAAANGKSRSISEATLQQKVASSKEIRDLSVLLRHAECDEEDMRLLLEAYKMRRDAIRVLADLRMKDLGEMAIKSGNEISARKAAEAIVEDLKEKYPGV